MRVICPFTAVSDETRAALAGVPVEFVDVSGSDEAYFDLLAGAWAEGEDFAVIEQDIVIRRSTLRSFGECAETWCAAPYPYLGSGTYAGLGCVRFRAELMRDFPGLFDDVARHRYPGHSPMHWCVNDAAMQRELWKRGRRVCARHRPVRHLHDMPSHKCC